MIKCFAWNDKLSQKCIWKSSFNQTKKQKSAPSRLIAELATVEEKHPSLEAFVEHILHCVVLLTNHYV